MLDTQALDKDLQAIIAKRNQIYNMSYDAPNYDDIEEELLDMEDDFAEKYGEFVEDGISEVYEQFEVEEDVAMCTSYIGRYYKQTGDNEYGAIYGIVANQGFPIESPNFIGQDIKVILLPNPVRVFVVMGKKAQEAWSF